MKPILFVALTAILCISTSCNTDNKSEVTAGNTVGEQKNLAAFKTVSKAFETGEVSGIDGVVADDYVDHTDRGDIKGKDSLKSMITMMHQVMKDSKTEIIHQVAKDDYVYSWNRYKGTSNGEMGMPKGPYEMRAIELVKFRDGKAIEHWAFMEVQDAMKMMAPSQPTTNK